MAYQNLELDPQTPAVVRDFITNSIEKFNFVDVHMMLRLPLPDDDPDRGLGVGCGFAITHTLLAVISGLSTAHCDCSPAKNGNKEIAQRFKNLLIDFCPWRYEPQNGSKNDLKSLKDNVAAGVIYEI